MMTTLVHRLDRVVTIAARPETVFAFFSDTERWAAWWGAGSSIDARPGGAVVIRYPNGVEAAGEVLEIVPHDRLVFTYGYRSGSPIPVGGSRVTIRLDAITEGTRVQLSHALADPLVRDQHLQGWTYQLSLFANVVANHLHHDLPRRIDDWFGAWNLVDPDARTAGVAAMTAPTVTFRDRHGCVDGREALLAHLSAMHRFMPGLTLARTGDVRHCQGTVLVEWSAHTADGAVAARGTQVLTLNADGVIGTVVGFWNATPEREEGR